MLFSQKPKVRIQTIKTYDGEEIENSFQILKAKEAAAIISEVGDNPKKYAFRIKATEGLMGSPSVRLEKISDQHYIIYVTYQTIIAKPRRGLADVIIIICIALTIWSLIGGAATIFMLDREAKLTRIHSQCYYYTKNGKPESLTIQGRTYKLPLSKQDRLFLNPWHYEAIVSGECTGIETGVTNGTKAGNKI